MDEEEHEVYGGEIPDVAEMDADGDITGADGDGSKVSLALANPNHDNNLILLNLIGSNLFDLGFVWNLIDSRVG
jgi:hypothetical protein